MKIIGIDDAGRGPVIGPMILSGVLAEEKDIDKIKQWGAKDSKLLTFEKRAEIQTKILQNFETATTITLASEIDNSINSGTNLNTIEAIKAGKIINELLKDKTEKVKVIIDCPSPNTLAWKAVVLNYIEKPEQIELYCEHKADLNHPIVSAASIIAKQTREAELEKIKQKIGKNCGSGYCSDPITKQFLEDFYDDLVELEELGLIRKSWQTWTDLINKKQQKFLEDF